MAPKEPDWQHRPGVFSLFRSELWKNSWSMLPSFFGSSKGEPQEDYAKQLYHSWGFNPNQSFGNRIANIAFAQGSQNSNSTPLKIITGSKEPVLATSTRSFFLTSIYYASNCSVLHEARVGPVKVSPRKMLQKLAPCCQSWFSIQTIGGFGNPGLLK